MVRSQELINRSYLKQQSLPVFVYVLYYCYNWYPYDYGYTIFLLFLKPKTHLKHGLVGWGSRIHQLHLCSWCILYKLPNKCPVYDTKQSDGETSVMLDIWGMWSIPSSPSFLGPLCCSTWLGPIFGSNRTVWHWNCTLNGLKENCFYIWLCVNKRMMFDWIVSVK